MSLFDDLATLAFWVVVSLLSMWAECMWAAVFFEVCILVFVQRGDFAPRPMLEHNGEDV